MTGLSLQDTRALGAIVLRNYTVSKAIHDVKRSCAFKLAKGGSRTYYLCADTEQEMNKYAIILFHLCTKPGDHGIIIHCLLLSGGLKY